MTNLNLVNRLFDEAAHADRHRHETAPVHVQCGLCDCPECMKVWETDMDALAWERVQQQEWALVEHPEDFQLV